MAAVQKRLDVFNDLLGSEFFEGVSVDVEHAEKVIRLLDAAVIKLEGGTELDLQSLDEKADEQAKPKEPELSLFVEEPKPKTEEVPVEKMDETQGQEVENADDKDEPVAKQEPVQEQDIKAEDEVKTENEPIKEEGSSEVKSEPMDTIKPEAANGEPIEGVNGTGAELPAPVVPARPRALHKTASIFLRNLPPNVVKSEVEAVSFCRC